MNKSIKRVICLLLTAVISLHVFLSADAADTPRQYYYGDVDLDNSVTIFDATAIQRNLASIKDFSELQTLLGDVDDDFVVSIFDVTAIQRRLAEMDNGFMRTVLQPWQVSIDGLTRLSALGSLREGRSYTGERIIFHISAAYHILSPDRFTVYVDDALVQDRSTSTAFEYTFDTVGTHHITIHGYDIFGSTAAYSTTQTVVEPTTPVITDLTYDPDDKSVEVTAIGGAAPYEYQYAIKMLEPIPPSPTEPTWIDPPTEAPTEEPTIQPSVPVHFEPNPNGIFTLQSDWTPYNKLVLPYDRLNPYMYYTLTVQARDSLGVISDYASIENINIL